MILLMEIIWHPPPPSERPLGVVVLLLVFLFLVIPHVFSLILKGICACAVGALPCVSQFDLIYSGGHFAPR